MERGEKAGLGVALAGHAALFALLSLQIVTRSLPIPPPQQAIEVSLAPDVALRQAAAPAPPPPAASAAPEQGLPAEEADTPPPKPTPVPPTPMPPKPVPAKPKPVAAKPDEPKPVEKPAPIKPAPTKPAPVKPDATRPAARPAPAKPAVRANPDRLAAIVADAERAAPAKAPVPPPARARGSRLSSDFLKGLADTPAKAPPSVAAPGAMSVKATSDIASAIQRQIQPCADRQVNPGPGAERIRVAVNLKLNRDGNLAAPPRVVNHDGLDVENRRYLDRVDDLAIAAFSGCMPLRDLPANLYDVPNGWRNITLRYKLPG